MMDYNRSLSSSVSSLSSALSSVRGMNESLGSSSKDFERVKTVLKTNQVFGVVTETDINDAKQQLVGETQPQIEQLLHKAEMEIARLERKERSLSSKADLQQVRLQQATSWNPHASKQQQTPEMIEQMDKLRELQQKRDRMAYSLSRLNLKGRKYRMSMAFTGKSKDQNRINY